MTEVEQEHIGVADGPAPDPAIAEAFETLERLRERAARDGFVAVTINDIAVIRDGLEAATE